MFDKRVTAVFFYSFFTDPCESFKLVLYLYVAFFCFLFISSPELKDPMSFSDRLLSVVRLSVCKLLDF
jgi:hypothetical protein